MMHYDEEAGDFVLTPEPLLRSKDNPHELMIVSCEKCFIASTDSREALHMSGWHALGEEACLCPECSKKKILWGEITD